MNDSRLTFEIDSISCTLLQPMSQHIEVRKDLIKVISLMVFMGLILFSIKLYDAKTNEVDKIGKILLDRYVN